MFSTLLQNWSFILAVLIFNDACISSEREILRDMLAGNRNRKVEQKIYKEQNLQNKVSLGYIFPYLKHYRKEYITWRRRYYIQCIALILEIVVIVIMAILLPGTVMWVCIALCAPEIRGCALAHAAATAVNISVTALCKRSGREQTKYQGKAAQEGEKSLQIHHTPFFLK